MLDPSNPPGFRLEACKVAMPYVHSKCADTPSEVVQQITEVRHVIVKPPDYSDEERADLNRGLERVGAPHRIAEDGTTTMAAPAAEAAPAPDPLTVARSRLDRMRGIH
jgi:hypothetical protein